MRARSPLLAVAGAVTFLTCVPLGRWVRVDARTVASAAPLYPLVGAAVGAIGGLAADAGARFLPAAAGAVLAVTLVTILTGAMHVDALADTADALGARTTARRLEVMRDHTVGAFGATAIVLAVALEITLVAELARRGDAVAVWAAAAAAARSSPSVVARLLPYARSESEGMALRRSTPGTIGALALAAVLCVALLGRDGLWVVASAAVVSAASVVWGRSLLGGFTGDTLGATVQVAELTGLAVAVALI